MRMPEYWYDHVHLVSPDVAKTAEFYEKNFNARRVYLRELPGGRMSAELNLNGSRILIGQSSGVAPAAGAAGGLEHFGIKTDNLESAVASLKANGVKFRNEIMELRPGVKITFMWGHDNVLIELLEIKPQK
jgi:catechol 2,3-dioxygenase-like lactoylglutathione lyase family enzyme